MSVRSKAFDESNIRVKVMNKIPPSIY